MLWHKNGILRNDSKGTLSKKCTGAEGVKQTYYDTKGTLRKFLKGTLGQ